LSLVGSKTDAEMLEMFEFVMDREFDENCSIEINGIKLVIFHK